MRPVGGSLSSPLTAPLIPPPTTPATSPQSLVTVQRHLPQASPTSPSPIVSLAISPHPFPPINRPDNTDINKRGGKQKLNNITITKMNRLFGSKPSGPKPTLTGAITNIDTRIASIDTKLKALNGELSAYQEKLSKMRDGPGKQAIKQKALKVLQRRKAYEAEKDKLEAQVWNMEQAQTMQDNLKNVMTQVDAMKTTNKELRKQYGKIDIDKIERLQDEMADLLDVGNEIQESLARGYDIPDEVDEAELDAELEALGMEAELEQEYGSGAVPGFLQDEVVPEFVDEPPQTEEKVKQAAG
ncbi:Snf7 domain-containing protein [Trichoderma aethiopicum]